MDNKSKNIILIVILSLVAILIIAFMSYLLIFNRSLNFKTKELLTYNKIYELNEFNNIKIDTYNFDIEIKENDNNNVKLEVFSTKGKKTDSSINNNTLNISNKEKLDLCIGFCFNPSEKIVLYLPKDINIDINVDTNSGDLKIDEFENVNLILESDSGDLYAKFLNSVNANLDSGDIKIVKVNILNAETDSGDILVDEFNISNNSSIKTDSGDVVIRSITDSFVDAKSDSGDIKIKNSNRYSKNELRIRTDSGDIVVK